MKRKKLPIGIQTFSEIREERYYYVDKTPHICRLVDEGKYYFLSRPRRFGKSLLIDTIGDLFEGKQALFTGLYAENNWDWDKVYPVLRFSFGSGQLETRKALDKRIINLLEQNQLRLSIRCETEWKVDVAECFAELIRSAHHQYGQKVVVLIDEYDKPILDNIDNPEVARIMREGLKNFYSVIKDSDEHIKFAMLTGVSKFSKVSLFSGLNNLNDITLDARYSSICGYTDNDVDTIFAPELIGLDREKIRTWYNGYNWLGEGVYNPFDLLLLFDKRVFDAYWFETGTPTFLIHLLLQRQWFTPELSKLQTESELLGRFDVDDIATEALLFQTGYLTIKNIENLDDNWFYTLGYPNKEVLQALNNALSLSLTHSAEKHSINKRNLIVLLKANNFDGLKTLFTAFYASIPYHWLQHVADYEGYYASVFYSYFASLGFTIICEDITNKGRIDMTVLFNKQVYIFEFKVVEECPEGAALAQIKDRDYAAKYRARNEPIVLIGVEFSKLSRSVVAFEVESLG